MKFFGSIFENPILQACKEFFSFFSTRTVVSNRKIVLPVGFEPTLRPSIGELEPMTRRSRILCWCRIFSGLYQGFVLAKKWDTNFNAPLGFWIRRKKQERIFSYLKKKKFQLFVELTYRSPQDYKIWVIARNFCKKQSYIKKFSWKKLKVFKHNSKWRRIIIYCGSFLLGVTIYFLNKAGFFAIFAYFRALAHNGTLKCLRVRI